MKIKAGNRCQPTIIGLRYLTVTSSALFQNKNPPFRPNTTHPHTPHLSGQHLVLTGTSCPNARQPPGLLSPYQPVLPSPEIHPSADHVSPPLGRHPYPSTRSLPWPQDALPAPSAGPFVEAPSGSQNNALKNEKALSTLMASSIPGVKSGWSPCLAKVPRDLAQLSSDLRRTPEPCCFLNAPFDCLPVFAQAVPSPVLFLVR